MATSSILSRYTLAHAVAGAMGSVTAMLLLYPIDRVRTVKQLELQREPQARRRSIVQTLTELIAAGDVYTGLWPMLTALFYSNFCYFYAYTALRKGYQAMRRKVGIGTTTNLLIASAAGVLNVFASTPFWVVYTRFAAAQRRQGISSTTHAPPYKGVLHALATIARDEGLGALWSGMVPSLMLVSNPTVQFAAYERLKQALLITKLGSSMENDMDTTEAAVLSSTDYLALGGAAKMVATLLTYPLQVAQTRLRAAHNKESQQLSAGDVETNDRRLGATIDCLVHIVRAEGFRGLYVGMDAKLLQTCLNSAFMFLFYERVSRAFIWLLLPSSSGRNRRLGGASG